MDFSIPEPMQSVLSTIRELLEREVYPLESALGSRPFAELVPALAAVRQQVKAKGLWAPQLPKVLRRDGAQLAGICTGRRGARPEPAGPLCLQLPGPRRGQHGAPPGIRHGRAERALADAPGSRRDPELLRDDRAGLSRLQPGLDGDASRPRRRRLRHRRPQVVRLRGRRRPLRHRHGRDRPGGRSSPSGQPVHRPGGQPGLPPRAQHLVHGACRGRLGQPRRAGLRGVPGRARRTGSARRGPGSPWPRRGWVRGESTTRCDGSGSADAPSI